MCFIEYLGYTCGHTGDSVLRPCPLTTRAHANPVCPAPAVRPQLSRGHCPACQRVMHNRWVDIMEEEHRWMHERGACGCPVEFPALMQPRMIGRDGPGYGGGAGGTVSALPNAQGHGYGYGRGQSAGSSGSGSGSGGHYKPGNGKNQNKNKKVGNKRGRGGRGGGGNAKHQHQQEQQPQPQPQDHQTKAQTQQQRRQQQRERYPAFEEVRDGENDSDVRYVIRQPSMYGVEWTWDHAKLHEDGRCACAVRFDKYDPSPSRDLRDLKHPGAGDHDAAKQVASYTYSDNTEGQQLVRTGGGGPSLSYHPSGGPTTAPTSRLGPQVSGGQPARWSYNTPAEIRNLQEIYAPPAGGADDQPRQLDMQTAWFGHQRQEQQQQAPMAGLSLGLGPECRDPSGHLQAEGQIVLYDVSQQMPLLGLPIGAGPEGLSHAGDFEDCELYRLGHAAQELRRCSSTAF
ncbi:hypothetical protein DL766_009402 [Monosporascus sp. MC13-8B]|uniref:Uncharacterized protein n=1 Tax=Monosporascus cannonballus TaxID=155416 RepID=A0ABY0HEV6_9PEZI|nr:hypothetical protein DL762_003502 [Monosporascus cannonballus]RYO98589.1 hypothetical protein DL763_002119 [Monosporascus cannonballus]RYP15495.1 hypothetical protein DL766_009402 [Monosporascus sp. MC13-8B]